MEIAPSFFHSDDFSILTIFPSSEWDEKFLTIFKEGKKPRNRNYGFIKTRSSYFVIIPHLIQWTSIKSMSVAYSKETELK